MSQITPPSLNWPRSRPAPQESGPADAALAEFEALYRANVGAVTACFARRSAEPQTVADLTADTLVQAITSFSTFDPHKGTPRAWVFGIARRIYAAHCHAHGQQRNGVARLAGAVAAAVMALGSAPAAAAYSVTPHANGTVTVSVSRLSGVSGANAALVALRARVEVVLVKPGYPPIGSLPRPHPAPHLSVMVGTEVARNGHRSVTVKVGKGGIPAGDTMILAFSGTPGSGTSLGAGGIIAGPAPHCVSLPAAP